MPIKNKEKAREYFKTYMANRRKGLTNEKENVKPLEVKPQPVKPENVLNPAEQVKPEPALLNPELVKPRPDNCVKPANVKPNSETLNPVKPWEAVKPVKPSMDVKPVIEFVKLCSNCPRLEKQIKELQPAKCPLNHHSLTELFQQATEQVQQAWQEIKNQGGTNQCYNCHNSQSNHQLAINLLEKYWKLSQKGEKSM